MANQDIVDGFKPYGPCLRARPYTAGAICYPGDALKLKADGGVEPAAATNPLCGVALTYAASGAEVIVADHPDQEFIGQSDDATIDAATDFNQNFSLVAGSPSTAYRRSGMEIDGNTGVTDSNLEFKVLRLLPAVGNALGTNCKVIFKINYHQLGSVGTLGVV